MKKYADDKDAVAFSPDGKRLASASWDGTVKLWDVAAWGEVFSLTGHTSKVWSVAFSFDGKRLATSSTDGTVKVWDAPTGQELLSLPANCAVYGVAWSPNGSRLAGALADGTVNVWDADKPEVSEVAEGIP